MSVFVFLITNFGQVGFVFVFWLTANLPDPFVFEFRLYVSPGEYGPTVYIDFNEI